MCYNGIAFAQCFYPVSYTHLTGPECSLRVLDVKKTPKGYYVHTCVLESGIVKVGDHLNAQVDKEYRMSVCRNHTCLLYTSRCV